MISFRTFNFILAKTQKSIPNNFCYVFVKISGKYKKYLAHMDTLANAQNNYLKLSGFGFNETRLLHMESDEKH